MFLRLFAIIKKEFLHLIRDPRSLLLMFVMPVLLLFIYGYAATFDIKEVPTAIFNQDKTATSRDFISRFLGSNYFILVEDLSSNSEFAQKLDSGKAKVIFELSELSKIKKGDILVTPMTTPEMIPVLKKASAIVTDEGGITCHATIVSRELKIPCVIGTVNASHLISDNDLLEVDANKGSIKIIKKKKGILKK